MRVRLLGATCLAVLAVILTLGLWPFHVPVNHVEWMNHGDGLKFGPNGTVFSSDSLRTAASSDPAGRSIEVWVRTKPWHSFSFLSFYNPRELARLSMRQSVTDLELETTASNANGRPKKVRLYVDDVLRGNKLRFVALTSSTRGTNVYVDGVLAKAAPQFRIAATALQGQLILGDAPAYPDAFRGELRGVAIYDAELTGEQVLRHYETWKSDGRPGLVDADRIADLYLLNEHKGTVIHDQIRPGVDLTIPERYMVVDKVALEPFWEEFELTESYGSSAFKNIIGFLPVGASFYLFLVACRWKRPVLATMIVGFLISLTIEVLQIYLPTRDSGTTDLITNTLGTYIGMAACRFIGPQRLLDFLPR